jgi:hypothetical protein
MVRRALFNSGLILGLVASAQAQEDPVLRARAQRASTQGISEGDLPPVPRGIVEPPPLPPPEAHVKDSRNARKAKGKIQKKKPGSRKTKSSNTKGAVKGTSR